MRSMFLFSSIPAAVALLVTACASTPATQPAAIQQAAAAPAATAQPAESAPAAGSEEQASATVTAANADPNEVICKKFDVLGTRVMKQRICKPRYKWQDDAQVTREVMNKIERANAYGPQEISRGGGGG